jgi:hypothetical protein
MLLQHDNARPHTILKTRKAITKSGRTVLPHPPYDPNLAPSDLHLFGALKHAVSSAKFKTDNDVISALRTCLHKQDKEWYRQGIYARFSLAQGCRNGQETLWKNRVWRQTFLLECVSHS